MWQHLKIRFFPIIPATGIALAIGFVFIWPVQAIKYHWESITLPNQQGQVFMTIPDSGFDYVFSILGPSKFTAPASFHHYDIEQSGQRIKLLPGEVAGSIRSCAGTIFFVEWDEQWIEPTVLPLLRAANLRASARCRQASETVYIR